MSDPVRPSPQAFLQELLGGGQSALDKGELTEQARALGKRGEDFLIDTFGMDDNAETRANVRHQAKLAGMAGALALVLKSRSARKLAALGGLAALGTIAYRGHQRGEMPTDFKDAVGLLKGQPAEDRATVLLRAMVAAARADGTIDADEQAIIEAYPDAELGALQDLLATPADPKAIAALAKSDQMAAEIYAVSARVAEGMNPMERRYLDSLAMALRLDPEVAARIETDMRTGTA